MANTWVTDITHFIENGALAPDLPGPARRLAEYLGSIIVAATTASGVKGRQRPRCRRRPRRQPCQGAVFHRLDPDDRIAWECSGCGDNGFIAKWRCTIWDCTPTHGVH